MSLLPNTTMLAMNETKQGQHHSNCVVGEPTAAEDMSKLSVYCFLLLASFFGNILIIIIVYKHRDLHKTVNYFIVNMTVSDLVFPLAVLPVQITAVATGSPRWYVSGILGSITCKFIFFAYQVSVLVSCQSLVWIAIDRFVAVLFPMRLGLISTKIRVIAIVSTWIIAAAFNFDFLVSLDLRVRDNNTFCEEITSKSVIASQEAGVAYRWLQTTIHIFAPLSLLTVLYTAIAVALKRQSKALANPGPNIQRTIFKKRKRAIQLSVVTMVMYYLCVSAPTLARLVTLADWELPCAFRKVLGVLSIVFVYTSTTVNPVICLSFVQSYRRGLRNILCSCFRKRNNEKPKPKREKITLKDIKNCSEQSHQRDSKVTRDYEETLDTVL